MSESRRDQGSHSECVAFAQASFVVPPRDNAHRTQCAHFFHVFCLAAGYRTECQQTQPPRAPCNPCCSHGVRACNLIFARQAVLHCGRQTGARCPVGCCSLAAAPPRPNIVRSAGACGQGGCVLQTGGVLYTMLLACRDQGQVRSRLQGEGLKGQEIKQKTRAERASIPLATNRAVKK
jgi:hypothetical protein